MLSLLVSNKGAITQASILGVLLCLATALFSRSLRKGSPAKEYPAGPKGWPVIGNLFLFPDISSGNDKTLTSMAKEFTGLCMLWLFSQPVLIVTKLRDAKELMDKRGAIFSDRPPLNIVLRKIWPNLLPLKPVGEGFRLLRRVYIDLLGPKTSLAVRKYQEYESRMMLRDLYKSPEAFRAHTERFSTSVIFSAVYGVRISRLDYPIMHEIFDIMKTASNFFLPGRVLVDYIPILERLPEFLQPWLWSAKAIRRREDACHTGFLAVLKKQIEAGTESYCFGIDVLNMQKKMGLDDRLTLDILKGIIDVGSETTSSMMQSIIKVLAMNPEAQKKAQEELDRVVGPSRLPTWEDSPNLPYIRALIKELHRFAPLLYIGVPHASTEEITYKGFTVPKTTFLLPNAWALSRDPERYQDPDTFAPERFLGDDVDSYTSAKLGDYLKRDHINYGWGRRLCQGIHLAENSLYMQVSRVLWAFDIATIPGEPPLNIHDKANGLIKKPKAFRVSIAPRSDEAVQVLLQSAEEAVTDLPDADSVEMSF
ncbi:Cytochrome P450 monooxygenase [Trichoderma lentiforme]|uniref:Cytochrome P450 monooxygenase n=1 Tax=Trichoderma lentiforme TaxID=1567552 RepID=A0A9P5C714_9HYPO|nr:Cytochrome P450 monooxygenase [Trichoderma lentiforme]